MSLTGSLLQIYPFDVTPSPPPVGSYLLFIKTDNTIYLMDSTGTEYAFGSTSAISQLSGEATAVGPGNAVVTLENSAVIGKVLTGFSPGPNSIVQPTDTILEAIQKLQAQFSAESGAAITNLTGDVTANGPGSVTATVNSVGGSSAANIHSAELAANAATSINTASTIVKRDASGNFAANTITATLVGNVTGNVTGNVSGSATTFTGSLSGDVTGTQSATSVVAIQGTEVSSTAPLDAQLLLFNSSADKYAPQGLSGDVSLTNTGAATVNSVGGSSAANIHSAELAANAATASDSISTIVKRDSSGNFSAGTITASLTGNVTGNLTGNVTGNVTGNLSGNVTGNVTGSVTGAASLNVLKSGDTMTGALSMSGNLINSLATPIVGTDAANKNYVDNLAVGIIPQDPILDPTIVDDSLSAPPATPITGVTYIIASTPTGAWSSFAPGYLVYWNGNAWVSDNNTSPISVGMRLGVNFHAERGGVLGGSFVGHQNAIATVTNATPGSFAYTFTTPSYRWTTTIDNQYSYDAGDTYYYNGTSWVEISTGLIYIPGHALSQTGNVLNVNVDNSTIEVNGSNQLQVLTAPTFTGSLSGDVTGTQSATFIAATTVTSKLLTGYTIGANTPISATDSVLSALEKLQGQISAEDSAAITALTGDVVATGPGSAAATIQANVVSNTKLAQMPADTLKGNNTGSTANASDLTATQVTAMLNAFTGDSGTGGVQGMVPAPAAGTKAAGDFLSANGSWAYVDQSNAIYQPFSFINTTQWTGASNAKYENLATYTGIDGHKQYAAVVAGGTAGTLFIWDITNPNIPSLCSYITLAGAYNVAVAQISGAIYAFVPSSGSSVLYIINITNPFSLSTTSSLTISGSPGSLYSCVYANGYVYIATQSKGLTVVDVGGGLAGGTLTVPVQSFQEGGTTNKTAGIAISGNIVYTTNYQTTFPATIRYLKTWELAAGGGTLAVPYLANTYTIPGGPTPTSTKPSGITISPAGTTAYVTDGNQSVIDVIDVTSPTSPNYLTYITPTYSLVTNTLEEVVVAPTLNNNFLYLPSGNGAKGGCIDLYDVTSPSSPIKLQSVYTGVANDVFGCIALNNGYIFGADYGVSGGYSGISVFTQALLSPTFGVPVTSNIQVQDLTPSTALVSNANNQLASSSTTATEIGYVHGVTSGIQSQINSVVASASATQTELTNYINPTSLQFGWLYQNPDYYTQLIYTGSNVTEIIYWDSPAMTTQLFTKVITYTGGLVTQVVLTRISDSATLTKNISYSGSNVSTVTRS